MKKGILISALFLAAGLLSGCREESVTTPEVVPEHFLGIAIDFPAPVSVRSDAGLLPATDEENAVHDLLVWVFRSDTHALVSDPLHLTGDNLPVNGGVRRYALPVTREFVAAKPDVDVFVLANAGSIGSSLSAESDWDTLNDACFGDSETAPYYGFGLAHPVHGVDPLLGLPITGCGKDLPVEGEDPILTVPTVTLTRAVSRLRFVFCKTPTDQEGGQPEEEVSILNVSLEGCMIPFYEYVFTTSASGVVHHPDLELTENYLPERYVMEGPATIAENESPRDLVYANQDAVTYDGLMI